MKFCYTAYRLFDELLNNKPMATGCYQWLRVFDGEAVDYNQLDDPEKYDVIQVNLDGLDCRIIPDLKHRLGNSSTIIAANQDYAPEGFHMGFSLLSDLKSGLLYADTIWATSPSAQGMLSMISNKPVHMIPHPCETHVLKHLNSVIENDWCIVHHHRYSNDVITPYLVFEALDLEFGLVGYAPSFDNNPKRTKAIYRSIVNRQGYLDFLKLIKEAKYALFLSPSYTYGRIPCDTACMHRPLITSKNIFSGQVCYPLTSIDPYDVKAARTLLERLMKDDSFYQEVCDIAYYNVEFFNHINSKNRFMEMIEMTEKGVPKKDGSGKGKRVNRGRGGCKPTRKTGKGSN